VWIRIRLRIRIWILSPSKKSKKNLYSSCFVTSFWLFIFENDVQVRGMDPRIRIRIHPKMSWIRNTGFSADPDPLEKSLFFTW
jgi:hypothetical protein